MVVEETSADGLSPQQALLQIQYLRELIDETRLRVADFALGYWGIAWIIGYLVTAWYAAPLRGVAKPSLEQMGLTWFVVLGLAGTMHGIRARRGRPATPSLLGRRLGVMTFVLFSAAGLTAAVLFSLAGEPQLGMYNAYWPFWVGVIYGLNGIFIGRELVWIGGWLIGASVASLLMPMWVGALWLAFAGGGGLVATGFLLRRSRT